MHHNVFTIVCLTTTSAAFFVCGTSLFVYVPQACLFQYTHFWYNLLVMIIDFPVGRVSPETLGSFVLCVGIGLLITEFGRFHERILSVLCLWMGASCLRVSRVKARLCKVCGWCDGSSACVPSISIPTLIIISSVQHWHSIRIHYCLRALNFHSHINNHILCTTPT